MLKVSISRKYNFNQKLAIDEKKLGNLFSLFVFTAIIYIYVIKKMHLVPFVSYIVNSRFNWIGNIYITFIHIHISGYTPKVSWKCPDTLISRIHIIMCVIVLSTYEK